MFEKKLLECLDMLPYPQRWQEFLTGPGDCFKYTVSKCLGYGIIAGSFLLKVPQLINIYRSQSAKGVSSLTYAGETLCYLIGLFYNMRMAFPFSTYGENVALSIQNILVLVMMFVYAEKQVLKCFTMLAFFSSISYAMLNVLTIESLSYLVGCNIAFAALAKCLRFTLILRVKVLDSFHFQRLPFNLVAVLPVFSPLSKKCLIRSFCVGSSLELH
eukprot:955734_1